MEEEERGLIAIEGEGIPVDRHPVTVYLATLTSKDSRRSMQRALEVVEVMAGISDPRQWLGLRYPHVAALRARLVERYAPASVNQILSALRGVARQSWLLGYITAEEYQRIREIPRVKGERLPAGRLVSQAEIKALFRACTKDKSPAGIRDAAILGLLYGAGLRRAEIVGLQLGDYQPDNDTAASLKVRGKGRRERLIWLANGALYALEDWITLRGDHPGPMFCAIRKDGKILPERAPLSREAIYGILRKRAREAEISPLSPHDLRRTYASTLLDEGVDLSTVQRLMGHSSVQTTARYDRRGEEAKRRAAGTILIPYRRRSH